MVRAHATCTHGSRFEPHRSERLLDRLWSNPAAPSLEHAAMGVLGKESLPSTPAKDLCRFLSVALGWHVGLIAASL